jgi:hypothetical protein
LQKSTISKSSPLHHTSRNPAPASTVDARNSKCPGGRGLMTSLRSTYVVKTRGDRNKAKVIGSLYMSTKYQEMTPCNRSQGNELASLGLTLTVQPLGWPVGLCKARRRHGVQSTRRHLTQSTTKLSPFSKAKASRRRLHSLAELIAKRVLLRVVICQSRSDAVK